jgi:hypothetical protein
MTATCWCHSYTLYSQFLVRFQPLFVLKIYYNQAYLVLGIATSSKRRYQSFDFFQDKVIYTIPIQGLYWRKVGVSSLIQGENNSGYHSNSRCSFICPENPVQHKVFPVLDSVYFPIQGGNILQVQGRPCIGFWWDYVPIQGHKFQYMVTIFCNSRLTLHWPIVLVKCRYNIKVMYID